MTLAGVAVFAAQGGATVGPFGTTGGAAAAVVALLGAIAAVLVPVYKLVIAHREKVSGDERIARTDERTDRKDSITEWQNIAATYKVERDAAMARVTELERQNGQLRDQHTADRMAGLIHSGWDFTKIEELSRLRAAAGLPSHMETAPPLYAPPVQPPYAS